MKLREIKTISLKTCKEKYDLNPRTLYNAISRKQIKRYGTVKRVLLDEQEVLQKYVYSVVDNFRI